MNIPIVFAKKDIPKIKEYLDKEIEKSLKEFKLYFNTKKEVNIKYEFQEVLRGYICVGDLYFGEEKVRHYDQIDEVFMDLNHMEMNIYLKNINKNNKQETEEEEDELG